MMHVKKKIFLFVCGVVAVSAAFFGGSRVAQWSVSKKQTRDAVAAQEEAGRIVVVTSTATAANSFNLPIPFISQAPRKNWDADHEEYCEEASLLMVEVFLRGKKLSVDEQETELAALRDWQKKTFGYFESVTVNEMARIGREYFKWERVRILERPTYEQLRAALAAGHSIIVPANGRALGNPFFSGLGPPYHVLVLRGITPSGDFITNDPGTKRGENYVYKRAVLMNVIHDYTYGPRDKKIADGPARVIIVEKYGN